MEAGADINILRAGNVSVQAVIKSLRYENWELTCNLCDYLLKRGGTNKLAIQLIFAYALLQRDDERAAVAVIEEIDPISIIRAGPGDRRHLAAVPKHIRDAVINLVR